MNLLIEFRWVHVHSHVDLDVADARMTKREEYSGDYDNCARERHTAPVRVAASAGPRGLYYTSSPCC